MILGIGVSKFIVGIARTTTPRLLFYQIYWAGNIDWSNQSVAKTTWSAAQQTVSNNLYNYSTYS